MRFRSREREEPEINLVPMIDVLLMTLIFLVLTTSFARQSALKVQLPMADTSQPVLAHGVHVTVNANGACAIGGVVVSGRESAIMALLRAHAQGPQTKIVLYADRLAPYSTVVHVLDAARRLGLNHIVFATKPAIHKSS